MQADGPFFPQPPSSIYSSSSLGLPARANIATPDASVHPQKLYTPKQSQKPITSRGIMENHHDDTYVPPELRFPEAPKKSSVSTPVHVSAKTPLRKPAKVFPSMKSAIAQVGHPLVLC